MIFWIIWICGLILTVPIFIIYVRYSSDDIFLIKIRLPKNYNTKKLQLLSIVSIIMLDALTITGMIYMTYGSLSSIIFTIFITLVVFYDFYLKLQFFYKKISKVILIILFIISIVGWEGKFYIYDLNIEVVTETSTETEERKLLSFDHVPIQDVSGYFGHYSGEITSMDEIPYWYLDDTTHKGLYDSAPATNSEIIFIQDNETSYLEIVISTTVTTEYNKNEGTQITLDEETSTKYKFYLPESQFNSKN